MADKPDTNDFAPASTSTTTSSSTASSTVATGDRSLSGDLPSRPGHRRSGSGALFYPSAAASAAASSATSPTAAVLPAGNICPSGKIGRSRSSSSPRSDVLGSGSGNYGHGSVIRGGGGGGGGGGVDAEEVKRVGNEMYKRGQFGEALRAYEKAIAILPENAAYRTNRAAALAALGRVGEAVKECGEALRIDPGCLRAHQRLGSLYLR